MLNNFFDRYQNAIGHDQRLRTRKDLQIAMEAYDLSSGDATAKWEELRNLFDRVAGSPLPVGPAGDLVPGVAPSVGLTPAPDGPNPRPGPVVVGPCGEIISWRSTVMADSFRRDIQHHREAHTGGPATTPQLPSNLLKAITLLDREPLTGNCEQLGGLCDSLVRSHLYSMWVDPWRLAISSVEPSCVSVQDSKTKVFTAHGAFGADPAKADLYFRSRKAKVVSWSTNEITFKLPDPGFQDLRAPGIVELRGKNPQQLAPPQADADTIAKTCGVSIPDLDPRIDRGTGPWLWILGKPIIRSYWLSSNPPAALPALIATTPVDVELPGCAVEELGWRISYDNFDHDLTPKCDAWTTVTKDDADPIKIESTGPLDSHYGQIDVAACDKQITLVATSTVVDDSDPHTLNITRVQSARVELDNDVVPVGLQPRERSGRVVLGCAAPLDGETLTLTIEDDNDGLVTFANRSTSLEVTIPHRETSAPFTLIIAGQLAAKNPIAPSDVSIGPTLSNGGITAAALLHLEPAKLGLALAGGGAKGSFQVGVLNYLADHHRLGDINILAGTSVGAINALGLIDTRSRSAVDRMTGVWLALEKPVWDGVGDFGKTMIKREPWLEKLADEGLDLVGGLGLAGADFDRVVNKIRGWGWLFTLEALPPIKFITGLFGGGPTEKLQEILDALETALNRGQALFNLKPTAHLLTDAIGTVQVDQDLELRLTAVSLTSGSATYFTSDGKAIEPNGHEGDIAKDRPTLIDAAIASAAVPVWFRPQELTVDNDKDIFVDGGVREVMPVVAASGAGAKDVIVVANSPTTPAQLPHAPKGLLSIAERGLGLITNEVTRTDSIESLAKAPDLRATLIAPTVEVTSLIGINRGLNRINIGHGYLRADDIINGRNPDSTTNITKLRMEAWIGEEVLAAQIIQLRRLVAPLSDARAQLGDAAAFEAQLESFVGVLLQVQATNRLKELTSELEIARRAGATNRADDLLQEIEDLINDGNLLTHYRNEIQEVKRKILEQVHARLGNGGLLPDGFRPGANGGDDEYLRDWWRRWERHNDEIETVLGDFELWPDGIPDDTAITSFTKRQ